MCGIHVVISRTEAEPLPPELKRRLRNRGPDHFGTVDSLIPPCRPDATGLCLRFTSTVLSLRGDQVTSQPFVDCDAGLVLCWNGEAWAIGGERVQGNDGAALFHQLGPASRQDGRDDVLAVIRGIVGPFAFVYLDSKNQLLYLGRDRVGRRSLLVAHDGATVRLASVCDPAAHTWEEVEADGIYVLSLAQLADGAGYAEAICRHDWVCGASSDLSLNIGLFNRALPSMPSPPPLGPSSQAVRDLRAQLYRSLSLRVTSIPSSVSGPGRTRVAVLFSGGIDCTVLARLASDALPPDQSIDLINVAFENPRSAAAMAIRGDTPSDPYAVCPDRLTGMKSLAQLKATCPDRSWRFIAVNVPYEQTVAHKAEIVTLMSPHNTEMDLSIALALYFAARGVGMSHADSPAPSGSVSSPARVLLSGLGADELFGGYTRHAAAFSRRGHGGLAEELMLDINRVGRRNLGRDDRVMSNWGREVRFPYLDEELVAWALALPTWEKCDFEHPAGSASGLEPGKRILRLLAAELGLGSVAQEKKRAVREHTVCPKAVGTVDEDSSVRSHDILTDWTWTQIQFGARTAKMDRGNVKGTTTLVSP